MESSNPTRANSALWAHYLEQQWGAWLTPFGGPAAAALLGATVAQAYALIWGDFVDRLFASNARDVTQFVQESGADVRPPWTATPLPRPQPADVPPWLRVALDEIADRQEQQQSVGARELQPV